MSMKTLRRLRHIQRTSKSRRIRMKATRRKIYIIEKIMRRLTHAVAAWIDEAIESIPADFANSYQMERRP